MAGYRPSYTISEDRLILRYLLDGGYVSLVMGNSVWKMMEKDHVCHERTWQSLKNRFRRHIVPFLTRPEYQLEQDEKELFKNTLKTISERKSVNCQGPSKLEEPTVSRSKTSLRGINVDSDLSDDHGCIVKKTTRKAATATREERSSDSFFSLNISDSSDTE